MPALRVLPRERGDRVVPAAQRRLHRGVADERAERVAPGGDVARRGRGHREGCVEHRAAAGDSGLVAISSSKLGCRFLTK